MRLRSIFGCLRASMTKFWFSKTRSFKLRLSNGMQIVSRAQRASEVTQMNQRTIYPAWKTCKSFKSKRCKTYKALNNNSLREPKRTWVFQNKSNKRKRNLCFSTMTNLMKLLLKSAISFGNRLTSPVMTSKNVLTREPFEAKICWYTTILNIWKRSLQNLGWYEVWNSIITQINRPVLKTTLFLIRLQPRSWFRAKLRTINTKSWSRVLSNCREELLQRKNYHWSIVSTTYG